ncbi:MAG: hypothetical protein ACYTGC_13815, partial [Planctomycetota bacterium]
TGFAELEAATAGIFGEAGGLIGREVVITSGAAQGETRVIVANTPDALTLEGEWAPGATPTSGDGFSIDASDIEIRLRDGTAFRVDLDGGSPTTVGEVMTLIQGAAAGADFEIRIGAEQLVVVDRTAPLSTIEGTVTAAADAETTALEDVSAPFGPDDGLVGYTVQITDGAGSGQERKVVANTAETLTVDFGWDSALDATSEYSVFRAFEVLAVDDSPARNDLGLVGVGAAQELTGDTPVAEANGFRGLVTNAAPGASDLEVTLRDGTTFGVDLDGVPGDDTLRDLLVEIQDQSGLDTEQFEARVDPGTGALQLIDRTSGDFTFGVSDAAGSSAASDLGLVGASAQSKDVDADGVEERVIEVPPGSAYVLEGNVLHGDTTSAHIGVRLDGDDAITTDNLVLDIALADQVAGPGGIEVASGLWGALGIEGVDGSLVSGSAGLAIEWADPGTDAGTDDLATLRELSEGLGTVGDLVDTQTLSGGFELELSILPAPSFAGVTGAAAVLNLTTPDVTDPDGLTLAFSGLGGDVQSLLEAVHDLSIEEVVTALGGVADYLSLLASQAQLGGVDNALAYRLPGLDRSLGEILDFAARFRDRIAALSDGDGDPVLLQDLQGAIDALSEIGASLAFDASTQQLAIDLTFSPSTAVELPFRLDLETLGVDLVTPELDTIGVVQDWSGADPMSVTASGALALDLSLDLQPVDAADPLGARRELPSLDGGSPSTFGIRVDDADLDFPTPLGSLAAEVVDGSFQLDEDGAGPGTNPAAYTATLPAGTYPIGEAAQRLAAADATATSLAGALEVELPLVFSEEIPPDQPPLVLSIGDLGSAAGLGSPAGLQGSASAISLTGPPVRSLQSLVSLVDDLDSFPGSFAQLFDALDAVLDEVVFGNALPLVGSQLADAIDFVTQIRDKVVDNLALDVPGLTPADVQRGIFEALGPGGLGWLTDRDANLVVDVDDVGIPILTDTRIEFELDLMLPVQRLATQVDLDLLLPGLGLDIDALVDVFFGLFDGDASTTEIDPLTLAFGVGASGAYLRPGSLSQARFDLEAKLRRPVALSGDPRLTFRNEGGSGTDTITRDRGSWELDGFRVGQVITVGSTPAGNQGDYEIAAIDAATGTITLAADGLPHSEGPVDGIAIEVNRVS